MIEVAIAGLAGWRVASLLVRESGPWAMFARLRAIAGVPDIGEQRPLPMLGGILSCVWCASMWTTAGAYAMLAQDLAPVPILAAAAVAVLAERVARPGG